jgi:hypothetical protein
MDSLNTLPSQLNSFFKEYQRLEKAAQHSLMVEMASYFEVFEAISKKHAIEAVDKVKQAPSFSPDQYHTFFSEFKPLYLSEKRRGAEMNVWQQSGLKRNEVRNTAVLAWWLDPQGDHGLGDLLIRRFLMCLPSAQCKKISNALEKGVRVQTESLPLGEKENRIDIEIQGPELLLFIEVKINAGEGRDQLARYQALIERKKKLYGPQQSGIIYLTRYQQDIGSSVVKNITWAQLADSLRTATIPVEARLTQALLLQFCDHIETF